MDQAIEVLRSLELEKRLSPKHNPEISWLYVFLTAFISYFMIISDHVSFKPIIGSIERYNIKEMTKIFPSNAKMQLIYSNTVGMSEGPLWIEDEDNGGFLLFSDLIENKIMRWDEGKGLFSVGKTVFSDQSGCYTNASYCHSLSMPGSNGLIRIPNSLYPLNPKTPNAINLINCQHGERAISLLHDNGTQSFIATRYKGRRFNSPNDIIMTPEGHIYFTDPPFGLYNKSASKIQNRELPFNGIYFIQNIHLAEAMRTGIPTNETKLVHKDMTRPNGLALSPDFSKLYVSNTDINDAYLRIFYIKDNGNLKSGETLKNVTDDIHAFLNSNSSSDSSSSCSNNNNNSSTQDINSVNVSMPDGIKVDIFGHIFATGPGGVLVLSEDGDQVLGKLLLSNNGYMDTNYKVTNLGFGGDGYLYITMYGGGVARVKINTKPVKIVHTKIKK